MLADNVLLEAKTWAVEAAEHALQVAKKGLIYEKCKVSIVILILPDIFEFQPRSLEMCLIFLCVG